MNIRTDLAMECRDLFGKDVKGTTLTQKNICDDIKISKLIIKTKKASKKLKKSIGTYITIETPAFDDNFTPTDKKVTVISKEIKKLIPKSGLVLVSGLGNLDITPDALGPKVTTNVLATRHIKGEVAKTTGLLGLRPTAVVAPGVLGKTGIETKEFLLSLVKSLECSALIVIDALASMNLQRLGRTVQISNTGISPGSGVGNYRPGLNKETLGIPVISIGVPTVVDAQTLAYSILPQKGIQNSTACKQSAGMIVTPRDIDLIIKRASLLIGMSINCALQDALSPDDLFSLIS